jgi:hypothetical protein
VRAVEIVEDAGFTAIEAINADEALTILESRSDISMLFSHSTPAQYGERWPDCGRPRSGSFFNCGRRIVDTFREQARGMPSVSLNPSKGHSGSGPSVNRPPPSIVISWLMLTYLDRGLFHAAARLERPRPRKWDSAGRGSQDVTGLGRRIPNVPLADAITAATLGEVDVDVVLMVAVRARTEYGREARTDRRSHRNAKVLGDIRIGRPHDLTTF